MSEDLNKLRELAESLQAGSAGFVRTRDFLNARHDFIAAFNPSTALSLLSRLQAAEERAEKAEHLVTIFLACHDEGPGLIDCIDNHGERYTSAGLFSAINAAREGFALKTDGEGWKALGFDSAEHEAEELAKGRAALKTEGA